MKVQRNILLLIAGFIWFIAGFNIMRIGIIASSGIWLWWMLCISIVVFLLFHNMVFRKMVRKHTKRILDYQEERLPFYLWYWPEGFRSCTGYLYCRVLQRAWIFSDYSRCGICTAVFKVTPRSGTCFIPAEPLDLINRTAKWLLF